MKNRIIQLNFIALVIALLGGCQSNQTATNGWSTYGEKPLGLGDAVTVNSLTGGEKNVVVHGMIHDVCQSMGCWLVLRDENGDDLFVRTKDHAYFVPRNSTGRNVVVRGSVEKRIVDVDELRHYAQDAHKSDAEIAAITKPETRLILHADSVMIAGGGLEKPQG